MSRVHTHTFKAIDGRRCDCHGTRRAGGVNTIYSLGVNAALSERKKDGALSVPSFNIAFVRVVPSPSE